MSEQVQFKFRHVGANGNVEGFLAKRGRIEGETLELGREAIPVGAIMKVFTRANRVILVINTGAPEPATMALEVYSNRRPLVSALNRACSVMWVKVERAKLEKAGRAHEFRAEVCPVCSCTLGLSRRAVTPQTYCEFCDAIYPTGATADTLTEDQQYRCCDTCGLFAKPSLFTTFYFYFLLVVFGWRYQQSHRCNSCMRGEAWKMLLINAPFVLGLFVAVPQLVRAYFGGSTMSAKYGGLDSANAAAKAGKWEAAVEGYRQIEERLGSCAGVRFNRGMVLAHHQKLPEAALAMEEALADCSNYRPAFNALAAIYDAMKEHDAASALRAQWIELDSIDDRPPAEIEPAMA